jgi:two-component system, cell cycle sensor histidine kinase and response regulator CckA
LRGVSARHPCRVADFDSGIRRFSRLAFAGRQPPLSCDKPAIGSGAKYFRACLKLGRHKGDRARSHADLPCAMVLSWDTVSLARFMQIQETYRVLVIDGDPDIHEEIRRILADEVNLTESLPRIEADPRGRAPARRIGPRFEVDASQRGEDGLAKASRARQTAQPFSVAFVDVGQPPSWDGIETIRNLWQSDPALEVVLFAACSDTCLQDSIHQLPMTGQLLVLKKPFDNIEVRQLAVALSEKWRLARESHSFLDNMEALVKARTGELEHSISLIQASENQYRLLFDSNPTPIFTYDDATLAFVSVNEAAVRHYGYAKEEFLKLTLRDLALPEDLPVFLDKLSKMPFGAGHSGIWRHRTKSGKLTEMEISSHHLLPQRIFLSLAMDVTERLDLEAQLRQSQKMESIGQLAGGIAHDFNNLLTVINGHASLLIASEKPTPKGADSLKEIVEAGKRANTLTRQLMTFSRKQELHPQVLDLNEVVNQVTKMLRRILGEDVALHVDFSPGLPSIKADLGMIEQVLLNLAVNSRDAMPRGGQLRIQTSAVVLDVAAAQQNPEASPGRHVCLTFSDSGCGIAPEHLGRIFEPFFTTKDLERGTGLGLATVYGIVKQHRGWITVQSRLGQGTTFQVFLPASTAPSGALQMTPTEQPVIGGTETVLVVEDETPLLKLMQHILEGHGYKVLCCTNGRQALGVWGEHHKRIDLLLTDLILPDGMAGTELARLLQACKPGLKVLFTSGYDNERLAKEFPPGTSFKLVQKPFHARKLAEMVFESINKPA